MGCTMTSAVYGLWIRQLKRYWRSRGRMAGMLGQPLLFLIALGLGFGPIYEKAGGGNFIEFLVPGIVSMTILFSAMFNGMEVIWDRQIGFLKETLVAPVSRVKIMFGRALGGATMALIQGLIIFLVSIIFLSYRPASWVMLFPALLFAFLIALLFASLGIAIASKLEDMQAFPIIINFVIMPLFFLSGALFPINSVPRYLEIIIKINPLSYGVEGLRYALAGTAHINPFLSFSVLAICLLAVGFLGAYLFSKIEA